jgi:pilus assembly protein Flp/PilA
MKRLKRWLMHPRMQELVCGQGLVEYALILILVAIVLIAILTVLSPGLVNIYQNIVDVLNGLP